MLALAAAIKNWTFPNGFHFFFR